jgi:hypothetical protein
MSRLEGYLRTRAFYEIGFKKLEVGIFPVMHVHQVLHICAVAGLGFSQTPSDMSHRSKMDGFATRQRSVDAQINA